MASGRRSIVRPFSLRTGNDGQPVTDLPMLISPGDVITNDTDYMRSETKFVR